MNTSSTSNGTFGLGASFAGICAPVASKVIGVNAMAPVTLFFADFTVTTLFPAALCMPCYMGMYVVMASNQASIMIHLRPIWTEIAPNTVKKGIAHSSAMATMMFEVFPFTFSTVC